jgi:hypothetical protein
MVNVEVARSGEVLGVPQAELKGKVLYGRFTPGQDVPRAFAETGKKAKQAAGEEYQSKLDKRRKPLVALERKRSEEKLALLTDDEIKKAQHYIACHADIPQKLKLEKFLGPGVLVKITTINQDPATVTFIDPFNGNKETQHKMSIAMLQEYAERDKKLKSEFSHEADILLYNFATLLAIPAPQGASFQNLFIDQLAVYLRENPVVFDIALKTQTEKDVRGILTVLERYQRDHAYQSIKEPVNRYLTTLLKGASPQSSPQSVPKSSAQSSAASASSSARTQSGTGAQSSKTPADYKEELIDALQEIYLNHKKPGRK